MKNKPETDKTRNESETAEELALKPGTKAPEFTLPATLDRKVSLNDLKGKRVILAFYPADWSPVCGDQLALYNEILEEFQNRKAELYGISVDSVWSHAAYQKARNLQFPLLSDFEPKGAVARQFGAYADTPGMCQRALFVIDENGVIQWSYVSPMGVNPGADGILSALDELDKRKAAA